LIRSKSSHWLVWLCVIFLTFFSAYLYAPQVLSSDFIAGDGGLFFVMTEELRENNYQIPVYTSYNHDDIPFAYPPLGFYFTAGIADVTGSELTLLYRLLPLVYTVLTVPLFYLLAAEVAGSKLAGLLATMAFLAMPFSLMWRLVGGGVVRALAFALALALMLLVLRLYKTRDWRWVLPTGMVGGLMVLTHLLISVSAITAVIVFFLFYGRNRKSIIQSAVVALIVVVIVSPWLYHVISTHGLDVLLGAYNQESTFPFSATLQLFFWNKIPEPVLAIFGVVSLLGMLYSIANKRWLPVAWMVAVTLLGHERGDTYMEIPMQILFGIYASEVILPSIMGIFAARPPLPRTAALIMGFVVILMNTIVSVNYLFEEEVHTLTSDELEAMAWVSENTPQDARFIIVSSNSVYTGEWFPALTDRHSLSTNQGYEWNEQWRTRRYLAVGLEWCASLACIEDEIALANMPYPVTHLFITDGMEDCECENLRQEIRYERGYRLIYSNDEVSIFERYPDEIAAVR
jgi:4-amino-4-deoxy-L-arabinose transferase-like glycosyltransferase